MTGWEDTTTESRTPAQLEAAINTRVDGIHDALVTAITTSAAATLSAAIAAAGGMINVKAAPYNAHGDGTTDDTAAIQAALDAAYAAGGGVVLFPPGVYRVSGISVGSYVTILGSGVGASIIKLLDNTTAPVLTTRHFSALTNTNPNDSVAGTDVGAVKFHLRDITFDGNKAGGGVGWVAQLFGVGYTVDHVEFFNGKLGGVYSEWRSTTGGRDMETFWSNFKIKEYSMGTATVGTDASGGGSYGLFWNGPHDTFFVNGVVATLDSLIRPGSAPACIGIYCAGTGVTIGGQTGGAAGELFVNVHVWGRNHYGFFPDTDAIYCANCVSEGAFTANVVMTIASVWIGGTVYGNNGANGTNEVGFQIGTTNAQPTNTYGIGAAGHNCSRSYIDGVFMQNFNINGKCFDFNNSSGENIAKAVANLGTSTSFFKGTIFPTSDHLELICHDHTSLAVITQPKYVRFNDGYNMKVKAGAPDTNNFGFADYASLDPSLAFGWLNGAVMLDSTGRRFWAQLGGVWYGSGKMALATEPQDLFGPGSPEGVVAAPVGSTWKRTDGGAGTSFYVKETGTGNTGWIGK